MTTAMRSQPQVARRHQPLLLAGSLVLVALLGCLDFLTGWEYSFVCFYLLPIYLVVHRAGEEAGMVVALASTLCGLGADILSDSPFATSAAQFWNAGVQLGFFVLFAHLLASLRRASEREKSLSRRDPLTGAANARAFAEALDLEVERSRRYRHPLSVVNIALDSFHTVHATCGQGKGDSLLRLVVHTLQSHIRRSDVLARLGEADFAVLLPETNLEASGAVVRRLEQRLLDAVQEIGMAVTFRFEAAAVVGQHSSSEMVARNPGDPMQGVERDSANLGRQEIPGPSGPGTGRSVSTALSSAVTVDDLDRFASAEG
jgi:diguanylate cyclase (GGDEF)-like protein